METKQKLPDLTREEFEVFLLIYVGHVDYNFSENEKEFIKKRTAPATFTKLFSLFLQNNDFFSLKIILKHKDKYYDSEESRHKLFLLLKDIFHIDGEYSRIEKVFVSFFQRLPNF
ncbi:MAG: hypothetical protein HKN67_13830 [Saprospiraceae bacterium]|nr:hypothetical protein [Saprospiraceae bacterium]